MTLYDNLEEFHGLSVQDFKIAGDIDDLASVVPRLRCGYDDDGTLSDYLTELLEEPNAGAIRALVLGIWAENGESINATPQEAVEFLVMQKDKLPNLEALFVGDIVSEENEISWIQNSDMSAIWSAFPKLEEFGVRGSNGLRLGKINHRALRKLVVESGGMPAALVQEVLDANAPLEHLELWLGAEGYGASTSLRDFAELLAGRLFPKLKTLALRNSEFTTEIAVALASAPILERLEHLDLSMGTLRDEGAEALAASGRIAHLKSLDITHHYLSEEVQTRLAAATPNLIAGAAETPDEWDGELSYYVSVSE